MMLHTDYGYLSVVSIDFNHKKTLAKTLNEFIDRVKIISI